MWFSAGIWSSASQCVARQSCCYQNRKKKPAAVKTKIVYQRAISTVIFFFLVLRKKEKSRVCQKQRKRKNAVDGMKKKDGQSRGARTCMYDFIRPKMETYLFPAKWRWPEIRVFFSFDAAFFSLFFNFVLELAVFLLPSLSYRTRERARQRNTRKKKHQKCTKNSNDLKCFAGQVLAVHTRGWSNGSKIY